MNLKAFLVDQSDVARTMLTTMLKKVTDYEIDIVGEAGTGEGVLIMLDEDEPDIVFLDMQLKGGMSCADAVREIKSTRPETKIILCATANKKRFVAAAHDVGADDFIEKPFNLARISRAIRNVMRQP